MTGREIIQALHDGRRVFSSALFTKSVPHGEEDVVIRATSRPRR